MDFNAEYIELFDAYLQGELSIEERLTFEVRLSNDSTFKAKFEAFQGFEQDLVDAEVTAFKDRLTQWDKSQDKNNPKQGRVIPIRLIGLAASIAVILFISILYLVGRPNNQDLVAANFEPYDNILTVRGEKVALDDGLQQYEAGEYEAAIVIFEQFPENVNAQFYLGESHLALQEFDAALTAYKSVLQTTGIFYEIAEFHLALSYLGNDDEQGAKETLAAIQKESDYYSKAQDLLGELE
ncbi:MAG: tetratricopeptide repeat protein [Crocinitomix sp.]|nr:tetratricopeptide repeat protein [Crocinitomix sp.]